MLTNKLNLHFFFRALTLTPFRACHKLISGGLGVYNFPSNPFSITPFTSYIPLFPLMREETWGSVRFLTRTVRAPLRVARSLLRYIVCTRRNSSPNIQVRAPLRVARSLLCNVLSERVTWCHPLTSPHIYCFIRPAK